MSVAARIVGDEGVRAVLAARDMPGERRGAAALDRRHHLELAEAHVAGIGATPCRPVVAEDIRDLQRRARHGRGASAGQALGKGDFAAARKLVHDNLLFQGPIDTFHSSEPYFEALKKLHPIIQRVDMKKIFADGNDVCVLYDMVTKTPAGTAFVCEWYKVKGEKIAEIRTV